MAYVDNSAQDDASASRRRAIDRKPDMREMAGPGDPARLDGVLDGLPVEDRKAVFDEIGKEQARILGARLVAQMLDQTDLSSREIAATFGFDHAALSRMANGRAASGPTLWKLFALAEALGYDLELKLTPRT